MIRFIKKYIKKIKKDENDKKPNACRICSLNYLRVKLNQIFCSLIFFINFRFDDLDKKASETQHRHDFIAYDLN